MSKVVPCRPTLRTWLIDLSLVALIVLGASGCNLNLDLDEHPYRNRDSALIDDARDTATEDVRDTNQPDTTDPDATGSDASDGGDALDTAKPSGKPYLIFTELMPDSSAPPEETTEYGEYLEVKNIGTAPADPRRIIIQLAGSNRRIQVDPFPGSDEEREVFEGLQLIEPGEYFVFIRQDDPHYKLTNGLDDGTFYEYGRWFDAVPLSNSSRRLQLSYRASEFNLVAHDAVEWASHRLIDPTGDSNATLSGREDVAWGVHPDFEDATGNNDPANWCFHVDALLASPVKASPGRPTPADCVREE